MWVIKNLADCIDFYLSRWSTTCCIDVSLFLFGCALLVECSDACRCHLTYHGLVGRKLKRYWFYLGHTNCSLLVRDWSGMNVSVLEWHPILNHLSNDCFLLYWLTDLAYRNGDACSCSGGCVVCNRGTQFYRRVTDIVAQLDDVVCVSADVTKRQHGWLIRLLLIRIEDGEVGLDELFYPLFLGSGIFALVMDLVVKFNSLWHSILMTYFWLGVIFEKCCRLAGRSHNPWHYYRFFLVFRTMYALGHTGQDIFQFNKVWSLLSIIIKHRYKQIGEFDWVMLTQQIHFILEYIQIDWSLLIIEAIVSRFKQSCMQNTQSQRKDVRFENIYAFSWKIVRISKMLNYLGWVVIALHEGEGWACCYARIHNFDSSITTDENVDGGHTAMSNVLFL